MSVPLANTALGWVDNFTADGTNHSLLVPVLLSNSLVSLISIFLLSLSMEMSWYDFVIPYL